MKTSIYGLRFCLLFVFCATWGGLCGQEQPRFSGYGVSSAFYINTVITNYSSYRIRLLEEAPNADPLIIPQGGTGYAWFRVEGYYNGYWYPVLNTTLEAQDEQGTAIACETRVLPYEFLSSVYYLETAGIFAVPIPAGLIGSGSPGAEEVITVMKANNLILTPENRQSVSCGVGPYDYTADWSYRLYGFGGVGATAGVVTATGFVGGGSGARISLRLSGTGSNPGWSSIRVSRRDDLFVGQEASVGPPTLIDIAETGVSSTVSFPYEVEYQYDLDNMNGLEAMTIFYLFAEPIFLYAGTSNTGLALPTKFMTTLVNFLISANAATGMAGKRISDEAGLDVQGGISFSVDCLEDLPLGMSLGAGLGVDTHQTASLKVFPNGRSEQSLGLSGSWNAGLGLGPLTIQAGSIPAGNFYPQRMNGINPLWIKWAGYKITNRADLLSWDGVLLEASIISDAPQMDPYDLPGQVQEYNAWVEIGSQTARTVMNNAMALPGMVADIGSAAVNITTGNSTFCTEFTRFLESVCAEQQKGTPLLIPYGYGVGDKSSYGLEIDLEVPIVVLPIVIKLGTGLEVTNSRNYDLAKGYWVKGLPYLQHEHPNPPQPSVSFTDVISEIWDTMTSGDAWNQLKNRLLENIGTIVISFLRGATRNVVPLNAAGSTLALTAQSMPAGVDSVYCHTWTWEETAAEPGLSPAQRDRITKHDRQVRRLREATAGMPYGIGGFIDFEADAEEWNEDPLLKIVYSDEEVAGLDESLLGIYREDGSGSWRYLNSTVVADSNYVAAYIPYLRTYTIGLRSPHGAIVLSADPDSLLADGIATAVISSDILHNNDGSIVSDGTLYDIVCNRGEILSMDADPARVGIQVAVSGGTINFALRSDRIPQPVSITATSVMGISQGGFSLPLYRNDPPATPVLISLVPEHRALKLKWLLLDDPGIVGYKIDYGTNPGAPYDGTSNTQGSNSPVTVGNTDEYILTGLCNDLSYYVSVRAIDCGGMLSGYSNEMSCQPSLQAVRHLTLEKLTSGCSLTWSPVLGAVSYKIYSADNPYTPFDSMTYLGQTFNTCWTDPTGSPLGRKFYRVVAIAY